MAAPLTLAGAIKARIESGGLGLAAYADEAPKDEYAQPPALPYVTITADIAAAPEAAADSHKHPALLEQVQVDLWQQWKGADGGRLESPTLHRDLARRLKGCQLSTPTTRVYGVSLLGLHRQLEIEQNIVHHVLQLGLHTDL